MFRSRRRATRWAALAAAAALVFTACGGDDEAGDTTTASSSPTTSEPASTEPGTSTPSSSEPGTTLTPGTSEPATTVAPTTAPATTTAPTSASTTTVVCTPFGAQTEVMADFPNLLSSALGADIRTGAHDCYERIVIELAPGTAPTPGGMPGYWVRYATGPITLGQTDDQFIELDGDADLLITMGIWMFTYDENGDWVGYTGPTDIHPTNVSTIEQLYLIDNWEGMHTWAVGIDQRRDFRVFTLTAPDRLVIDLAL